MFPLQQSKELVFEKQDLVKNHAFLESKNLNKKRQTRSKYEETNDLNLRKIVHRDIERQRRKEMATLYDSLRSLLPLEYIRGKRSVSDHMHEAAKYIKHMERNIKEMEMKRDKLKKLCKSGGNSENGSSNNVDYFPNCVTLNPCLDGVEILISCGLKEEDGHGFPLSRVLVELIGRGLNIVSCISTKANEKILHRIQIQVNDLTYINLPELQQRLVNVMGILQL